jgi:DUF4097 and DUF4098 domain-containing protein YvlB
MTPILTRAVACLAVATAGCSVQVDSQSHIVREEKRFAVSGTPDVRLTTFDGAIEIRSWDRAEVLVEIEKRGPTRESVADLQVRAEQKGATIELEVKAPRREAFSGVGFYHTATARLIVSLPRRADVRARTGDGAVRIDGVEGRIELRTGDGSIRAAAVSGELTLNTGDGSITVQDGEGRLNLDTSDGGVNVSGRLSAVKLRTGDGSIVYRVETGTTMSEDWDITTGDGGVSLYVPPDFGAEIDAQTGDGRILNDLNMAMPEEDERRTVRGRLGPGGKQLRIRTGDGSIRLRRS